MSTDTAPIRLGMVGGGQGAFMGQVHRIAARLDGRYQLVAGALSSRADVSLASGRALGLDPARVYVDFAEMARSEAARADGIEAVAIVTPNHLHFAPAKVFLEAGIHVICDKPLTARMDEAAALSEIAAGAEARFLLTHTYAGYPLVRQARAMVEAGELGQIRFVEARYAQDWLTEPTGDGNKQAAWRTDPAKAGAGGAIGDIGTHAWHLARFVTGLELEAVAADLAAFVPGRRVDDHAQAMLRFRGGAKGMFWVSQVAVGSENALSLRVVGEKASLEWAQEDPNRLCFARFGYPKQTLTRGGPAPGGAIPGRIPPGHPEGYLEAFSALYDDFATVIRGGTPPVPLPSVADGLDGMRFISACLASSAADAAWTTLEDCAGA